jgi:hypothetical protein
MADRNVPEWFTFEEWRVEFNELASDVGDVGNLPTIGGNSVTDLVEAVDELNNSISVTGITLAADYGAVENLVLGDTLSIEGTANEIETFVLSKDEVLLETGDSILLEDITAPDNFLLEDGFDILLEDGSNILIEYYTNPTNGSGKLLLDNPQKSDTITIGLPDNVTITNNLNVGGNVDVVGNITLGGNITIGDAETDSIDFNADVTSNIVPDVDNILLEDGEYMLKEDSGKFVPQDTVMYDLGEEGKYWRNIYLDNGIIDGNGNQFTLPVTSGQLATTGFGIALAVALG